MLNPSPADVQELLTLAEAAISETNAADLVLLNAQQEVAELDWTVDTLKQDMAAEFRKTTRKMDAPRQRRVMRRYGFVFTNSPESEEPELEFPTAPEEPTNPTGSPDGATTEPEAGEPEAREPEGDLAPEASNPEASEEL